MSFLSSIGSSKRKRGRKTVLCGTGGVGKTTAASKWPKPVLLATEDGASDLAIPAFFGGRPAKDYNELMGPIMEMGNDQSELDFQTLIIDSADWAELIFQDHIAGQSNVDSVADIDFGKGHNQADHLFDSMLRSLDHLREKGMHIVMTCHAGAFKFEDPSGASFDVIGPKLHTNKKGEGAGAILFEWADEFFFIRQPIHRIEQKEGFGNKRVIPVADGDPMVFTRPEPALRAKCRLPNVPPTFSRDEITNYIAMIDGNISGDIVDGSSKMTAA
jgi:hypothetical protein